MNADSNLSNIGVDSNVSGAYISLFSASVNFTSYTEGNGSTDYVAGVDNNTLVNVTVVGNATVGDVLTIKTNDPALSGGQESVSYTVQSGDTLASIASQLSSAINADSSLSSLGVHGYYVENSAQIFSDSGNVTTYTQSISDGATEGIVFSLNPNLVHYATIAGAATVGDVITLTVYDSALSGGSESVNYTVLSGDDPSSIASGLASAIDSDSELSAIMTGYNSGGLLGLESFSLNNTSYRAVTNAGATETIVLGTNDSSPTFVNFGGRQFQYNNTNELVSVSPGGVAPFQGTTNKAVQSASVASNVISVTQAQPNPTTYSTPQYSSATESVEFSWPNNGNSTALVYGTVTVGDVVSFIISNSALPGGQEQPSYTVQSGDTVDSIAAGLADAVNADANLATLGITASSSSANVSIQQPYTTYYWYNSSGATEYLSLGPTNNGNIEISVSGTPTTGDTLTITATNGAMAGGESSITYTVQPDDTLISIASALAVAVNANSGFTGVGIAAFNGSPAVLKWSQAFSANTPITSYSPIDMSGTDASDNTASTDYTMYVQGVTSFPTYDFNGNMTSDGTNTYSYDAENRLIQINYPGDGNYSQFTYDGLDHCVEIVETVGESVSSTKQFVWSGSVKRESRDGDGDVLSQYFNYGQTIGGDDYFYTKDHLASVRELTDTSGNIQAQYEYDSYGRVSQVQGGLASELQYAGYYLHGPSGLNLTVNRAYNAQLGRWINRDPIQESGGVNLYDYVNNNPISSRDFTGLFFQFIIGGAPPPPPPPPGGNNAPPPNPCPALEAQMKALTDNLKKQDDDLKKNPKDLPEKQCNRISKRDGSVEGHQEKFKNTQNELKKLVQEWDDNNCGPLPADVVQWKDAPPSSPDDPPFDNGANK